MRFRVCPYQYVGEGSPDKGGGKYLGTCKQHIRLVILVSVGVTRDNRWQEAELKEVSCSPKLPRICVFWEVRR